MTRPTLFLLFLLAGSAIPAQAQIITVLEVETDTGRSPILQAKKDGNRFELLKPDGSSYELVPLEEGLPITIPFEVPPGSVFDDDGLLRAFAPGNATAFAIEPGEIVISPKDDRGYVVVDAGDEVIFPEGGAGLVVAPPENPGDSGSRRGGFSPLARLERIAATGSSLNDKDRDLRGLGTPLRDVLEDPETLNSVLDALLKNREGLAVLQDIDFKFLTFDNDGQTGLGFSYDFDRALGWTLRDSEASEAVTGLSYSISARGNVAFEREINPDDFLDASLSVQYLRSSGGTSELDSLSQWRFVELATAAADYNDDSAFRHSPEFAEIRKMAQSAFTTQVYWELGLAGSIEANQDFTQKNRNLGATFVLDVKAWKRGSTLADLNVFDWPFALLRLLSGYDGELSPRGSTIPTVLLGYDFVNPSGDTPRAAAGDDSHYHRLRAEFAMATPLGRFTGTDFQASVNWRLYYEIDAMQAVKDAGLDFYNFFTFGIESEQGLFVSYANGRQPFDTKETSFYELGWKTHF